MNIPQAMAWKYNARCSKNQSGDDILVWEHPTMPKPGKAQVHADVAEYDAYVGTQQYMDDIREEEFNNNKLIKALARATRDYVNELRALQSLPDISNQDFKVKVKSYL